MCGVMTICHLAYMRPIYNINPCGYQGLRVTQCVELGISPELEALQAELTQNLIHGLQQYLLEKNSVSVG